MFLRFLKLTAGPFLLGLVSVVLFLNLPAAAQEVWHEELDRVTQSGTSSLDSSLFADYCCLAAIVRATFKAGEVPKGNQLVELRKQRELLGIGGAPSRAQRGKVAEPDTRNEFAKLLGE